MTYVILHDGPRQASAFSVSLLAGCAGFSTEAEFLEACRDNDDLLMNTAHQVSPFMREEGVEDVARHNLLAQLQSKNLEVIDAPLSAGDAEFEDALRASQGEILIQSSRLEGFRKMMTTAALALATSAALALAGAAPEAHASGGFERFAKDALGGMVGGAVGGQFGKGRGKTAMQVVGAVAGVVVAESMQRQQQANTGYGNGYPSTTYGGYNQNQYGSVAGGTEQLTADKREKMFSLEVNTLKAREAYAKSLAAAQQAEDGRVLDPRDKRAYQNAVAASSVAQSYGQAYNQVRSDFVNAYEYLARRGCDVHEFSFSYSLAQRQVSAREANLPDLPQAGYQPQPRITEIGSASHSF